MARWSFYDGTTTYTLPINPDGGGSFTYKKRIHRDVPCNPAAGFVIRMEGRPEAPATQVRGTLTTEAQWNALISWMTDKAVVQVTDDLGRVFSVVITSLQLTPNAGQHSPWRTTFTMDYTLLTPAVI